MSRSRVSSVILVPYDDGSLRTPGNHAFSRERGTGQSVFQSPLMIRLRRMAALIVCLSPSWAVSCAPGGPGDTSAPSSDEAGILAEADVLIDGAAPASLPEPVEEASAACPQAAALERELGVERVTSSALANEPSVSQGAALQREAARLEAAWCLVRNNEAKRARTLLSLHGPTPSEERPLGNYAALVAAEAALQMDEPAQAAVELAGLKFPQGPARRRLRLGLGTGAGPWAEASAPSSVAAMNSDAAVTSIALARVTRPRLRKRPRITARPSLRVCATSARSSLPNGCPAGTGKRPSRY
jgi:hypothetical protein